MGAMEETAPLGCVLEAGAAWRPSDTRPAHDRCDSGPGLTSDRPVTMYAWTCSFDLKSRSLRKAGRNGLMIAALHR